MGGGTPRRPRPVGGKPIASGQRVPPSEATPVPDADLLGPRPVSARQQAHREGRISGADIIERAVPRRAVPTPPTVPTGYRRSHVRDADMSARRVHGAVPESARRADGRPRANRRRVDWWMVTLRCALGALVIEGIVTLLFSPRLYVTQATIEGNTTVPTAQVLSLMHIGPKQNILRLPLEPMRKALLSEPKIAHVALHRRLPGTIQVTVTERQPWATVCLPSGGFYTIDETFVPFRETAGPEPNLPKLTLAAAPADGGATTPPVVTLGKPLTLPGLDVVGKCLTWAAGEKLVVGSVEIAPDGKLCLNKAGGAQIQLGSGVDLDAKLKSLSLLLARRPELRTDPDLIYINVFDKDGPAVLTKTALAAAKAEAAKKAEDAGTNVDNPAANPGDTTAAPAATNEATTANPDSLGGETGTKAVRR